MLENTHHVEGKEICIGDVYKLLLQSSQDISRKIDGLENKLKNIELKYDSTINELNEKVQELETENKLLKTRFTDVERKLRSKNLVFYGVQEEKGENLVLVLEKLLHENLKIKLEKYDITNVFRMGKDDGKPRPILIELLSEFKRREIITRRQKLKGTNIFISEDLIPADRREKKVLVEHLKLARSRNKSAQLRGNKLLIEGEVYLYTDLIKKGVTDSSGYYSPPLLRKATSVPSTPSEASKVKVTEDIAGGKSEHLQASANKSIEKKKEAEENKERRKQESNAADEKKRKLENSPNSATGAVPKIIKTRSGSKNRKDL